MNNVISEYQKWKQQGEDLRIQAKEAMESRFRELLAEAVELAEEYRADFGAPLKPPAPVTAFRYKAHGKAKPRKAAHSCRQLPPQGHTSLARVAPSGVPSRHGEQVCCEPSRTARS